MSRFSERLPYQLPAQLLDEVPDASMDSILGEDFLAWLTLALGGALAVGTGLALLRPQTTPGGEVMKAPLRRSLIQITIGSIAAIWAVATIAS